MSAFVSIIVPVYKVPEHFLRKCIESLLNQSMKNIEIILVNDGSPDDCGKVCDEYQNIDKRIIVIHKENGGLSAARNTGFYAATGEWITFVDGDDWVEPNMCEEMHWAAQKGNIQLVMCGISKDYGKSSNLYEFDLEDGKVYSKEECRDIQSRLLVFNGNIACAYAKLISRSFLVENNITHDEILRQGAEGLEFNLRLFDKLEGATFVNNPFYHYIFNPNSISASYDEKNNEFVLNCFIKIKEFINTSQNREILLNNFYNRLVYVTVTTAISGYFNPENKESYKTKVGKYKEYLSHSLIRETIEKADLKDVSILRKFTFLLIKYQMFFPINLIAYVRRKQLRSK